MVKIACVSALCANNNDVIAISFHFDPGAYSARKDQF